MNKLDIIERNEFGRTCLIRSAYQVLDKLEVANATVVRVGGKAARKEIRLVDRDALREAVLNAIIHNDYILGSFPVFEIYDDRIEIVSSGGLPIGLSQEEFFKGLSHPRNRELMRIFLIWIFVATWFRHAKSERIQDIFSIPTIYLAHFPITKKPIQ